MPYGTGAELYTTDNHGQSPANPGTNDQRFTVTDDDGLTLIIGGVDLGFNAGPTAPTRSTETYTGPSGTFAFDLVVAYPEHRKVPASAGFSSPVQMHAACFGATPISWLEGETHPVDRTDRFLVGKNQRQFLAKVLEVTVDGAFGDLQVVVVDRVEELRT